MWGINYGTMSLTFCPRHACMDLHCLCTVMSQLLHIESLFYTLEWCHWEKQQSVIDKPAFDTCNLPLLQYNGPSIYQ